MDYTRVDPLAQGGRAARGRRAQRLPPVASNQRFIDACRALEYLANVMKSRRCAVARAPSRRCDACAYNRAARAIASSPLACLRRVAAGAARPRRSTSGPTPTAASSIPTSRRRATSRSRPSQGAPPPSNPERGEGHGGQGSSRSRSGSPKRAENDKKADAQRAERQAAPSSCKHARAADHAARRASRSRSTATTRRARRSYMDDADRRKTARRRWRPCMQDQLPAGLTATACDRRNGDPRVAVVASAAEPATLVTSSPGSPG